MRWPWEPALRDVNGAAFCFARGLGFVNRMCVSEISLALQASKQTLITSSVQLQVKASNVLG